MRRSHEDGYQQSRRTFLRRAGQTGIAATLAIGGTSLFGSGRAKAAADSCCATLAVGQCGTCPAQTECYHTKACAFGGPGYACYSDCYAAETCCNIP